MKLGLLISAVAATSALAFASAHANTVTINYQGVVDATPDVDIENLFGGGDLAGQAITAAVVYDTANGVDSVGPGYEDLSGGLGFYDYATGTSYPNPIVSESFTINGYTYSFAPDYYGDVYTQAGSGLQQSANTVAGDSSILTFNAMNAPATLNYSFTPAGSGYGYLLTAFDANNNSDVLSFAMNSATVSAAPEPSTWAFALLGVGLSGLLLRRGRKRNALTLAA